MAIRRDWSTAITATSGAGEISLGGIRGIAVVAVTFCFLAGGEDAGSAVTPGALSSGAEQTLCRGSHELS
jgi:hypothetical protein